MTTREDVIAMMEAIGQMLLYEDENNLTYENSYYGEPINFEFENGILVKVYSWQLNWYLCKIKISKKGLTINPKDVIIISEIKKRGNKNDKQDDS